MNNTETLQIGQLDAVRIRAADGAQAVVTLFGAHLVSWITADGREQLFCSARSVLDGRKAIRGGVPVIFPQFSERGSGMRHGFARMSRWRLIRTGDEDGTGHAEFALDAGDRLAEPWPHAFNLLLRVEVCADTLVLSLRVRNTGTSDLSFSAALHTYFAVDDIAETAIDGLQQVRFVDQTLPGTLEGRQEEARLTCRRTLDRIYYGTPARLHMRDAGRERVLEQDGFVDTVVWNPGPDNGIADLGAEEHRRFICVEPACIAPVTLSAGAEWQGRQRVRAG